MAFCARPMLTAWSISRFRANLLAAGFMTGFCNSSGAEILAMRWSMAGPTKVASRLRPTSSGASVVDDGSHVRDK